MFSETEEGVVLSTPGWRGTHRVEGREVPIQLNALGMRGPEVPAAKAPGERRALVLGDSFVFGYGVSESEAFPAVLESRLSPADGGKVRVGNAGIPSYGLVKQLAMLRRVGAAFHPDVVVACSYIGNDFEDDARTFERVVDGYWLFGWAARFAEVSWRGRNMIRFRTACLLERWLAQHLPALAIDKQRIGQLTRADTRGPEAPPEYTHLYMDSLTESELVRSRLETVRSTLARIRELAAPAPVLLVVIPQRIELSESEFQRELTKLGLDPQDFRRGLAAERVCRLAAEEGLEILDLSIPLAASEAPDAEWQPDGGHFSVQGNQKVAALLEPYVERLLGR
jgi:lysophospholipase L1-like esterase